MHSYEDLFDEAKTAAFASIAEPFGDEGPDPMFGIMDGELSAVEDILPNPDEVEHSWLMAMLQKKPELMRMTVEPGTLAEGVVVALRDFMLDEMEEELTERARELGYDMPKLPAP